MKHMLALSELTEGQKGKVFQNNGVGGMRRRLQDIGLIPGTEVKRLQASPLGDPCAYQIRGAVIALRQQDACRILVETL